ncbi:hypothetical protein, partial [Pseudomonas putida]|uniref:hypothetical protein n=1 Tax=Pseudomonas putida TaxID=303 RepID=UPI002365276F
MNTQPSIGTKRNIDLGFNEGHTWRQVRLYEVRYKTFLLTPAKNIETPTYNSTKPFIKMSK